VSLLDRHGLVAHAPTLVAERFTLLNVSELTNDDLRELGVPMADRKKMLRIFDKTGAQAQPPPPEDCQICMERRCDTCLVPCGHACICGTCAECVRECPWCIAVIQQRVRTFR
jgi:hypothetical protein